MLCLCVDTHTQPLIPLPPGDQQAGPTQPPQCRPYSPCCCFSRTTATPVTHSTHLTRLHLTRLPAPLPPADRFATVLKHFPSAMGVDDFIARTEVALCYFGFTGDNTIGE